MQRKFEINIGAYGGEVSLFTITAPGQEVLPWECAGGHDGACKGEHGCRVAYPYGLIYEATVQARMSRLWEAAQVQADRRLRKQGYTGQLPRQLGNVRAPQERGVSHFHYALPEESPVEKLWSRYVRQFIRAAWKAELAHFTPDERLAALEREAVDGTVTRGVYGFGFSHPGKAGGGGTDVRREKAARYMARNAAAYIGGQGGRHYVSARLTQMTGATMRKLRGCNYLWVRRKLGIEPWVPAEWAPDFAASVLGLFALVDAAHAP